MRKIFTLIFTCFCVSFASAQAPVLTASSSTYTSITNGTHIFKDSIWDDLWYSDGSAFFDLGFKFKWKGIELDSVNLSDGNIYLYQKESNNYLDIGIYDDLLDRGSDNNTTAESPIYIKKSGTSPNAMMEIEWRNAGMYYELDEKGTTNDSTYIKITIHEMNSIIDLHYGPNSFGGIIPKYQSDNVDPTIDIEEEILGESLYYTLNGAPNNPTLLNSFSGIFTAMPANGQKYSFTFSATNSLDNISDKSQIYFAEGKIRSKNLESYTITIFDMAGKIIETGSSKTGTYAVQSLSNGIYIASVTSEGKTLNIKFCNN